MNPDVVFKAYDVRGRTDTGDLDAEVYRRAGAALVRLVGVGTIAVGRDCRATSGPFFDALVDGILSEGGEVIDLGEVPTDVVYYYSGTHEVPGAMITASHNPPEYNGLKLCRAGALPIGAESGLSAIRDHVVAGPIEGSGSGSITVVDPIPAFIDHLFSIVDATSIGALSVAVDGGNGMAGVAIERVFDRIAAEMSGLYIEPDGTFPNHPADPLVPENLVDIQELVTSESHDLGVAFDGDADRAFFLDDMGEPLPGSTVTSLIARAILQDRPHASIVHNLITSKSVPEIISESGGTPIRTRVGHSYIKQVMADEGAAFGGEHSGHYYFEQNFRADSGMLAMLYLLRVLTREARPLSQLRAEVERYHPSGEINFVVRDAQKILNGVAAEFPGAADLLDGVTIETDRGWFNLRPSNTEPLLRLNAEAGSRKDLDELLEDVTKMIERHDESD